MSTVPTPQHRVALSTQHARNHNWPMAAVEALPTAVFTRLYNRITAAHLARAGDAWTLTLPDDTERTLPRAHDALRFTHIGEQPRTRVAEKYLRAAPRPPLQPDDIVVDIGAFLGEFAAPIARDVRYIHCIEPDPVSAACCRQNTPANVTVHEAAAWHTGEALTLTAGADRSETGVFDPDAAPDESFETDAFRVDELVDHADVLKVEAEGAEPEALLGCRGLLNAARLVVVDVSLERGGESPASTIRGILREHDYVCTRHDDVLIATTEGV